MKEVHSKLQKLHTFRDDFERAKKAGLPTVESTTTAKTTPAPEPVTPAPQPAPVTPKTTSKPVFDTPEPEPIVQRPNKPIDPDAEVVLTGAHTTPDEPIEPFDVNSHINPINARGEQVSLIETDNEITEGNIITDHKRDTFRLIPAMWKAFLEWLGQEKEEIELRAAKRQAAIPKVRQVEERKQILEKAATSSNFATKNDKLTVKESAVKEAAQKIKPEQEVLIKDKSAVPSPSWSHYQDENTPAPAAPAPQAVAPKPEPIKPAPEPTSIPTPEPEPLPKPEPVPTPEPSVVSIPPTPTPEPVTTAPQPAPEPKPIPTPEPTPVKSSSFNWGLIFKVIFALIVTAVLGAAASLLITKVNWSELINGDTTTDITDSPFPNIPDTEVRTSANTVILSNNRTTFLTNLSKTTNVNNEQVTYYKLISNDGSSPATNPQVIQALAPSAPGSFQRTINSIRFGRHFSEAPVLILSATSFEAAFGGILHWEDDIVSDLKPLFGVSTTSTSTITGFVDEVIQNTPIRVLRDAQQEEQVVYGFIDQHIIVITSGRSVFSDILNNNNY